MKETEITCCICGKKENPNNWVKEYAEKLMKHQMCFECNHWRLQHEADIKERGEHGYAIVGGGHYTLHPHTDGYFKGFGGRKFKFEFFDGHIEECDNVWFQGDITEAHPHWREVMPDNAKIIQ
jgi:hypothetical protein